METEFNQNNCSIKEEATWNVYWKRCCGVTLKSHVIKEYLDERADGCLDFFALEDGLFGGQLTGF